MPPKFLVVDFHAESRYLLVKTLLRKFPGAAVHEADEAAPALELAAGGELDAIVSHRTFEVGNVELVREFRRVNPAVPIVMVSGIDRREAARAAGATCFLPYEEWLRIGSVVEAHLRERPGAGR